MSKTSNLKRLKQLRNWYDNEFKHCKSPKRNVSKKRKMNFENSFVYLEKSKLLNEELCTTNSLS